MSFIPIADPFPSKGPIRANSPGFYERDEPVTQVINLLQAGESVSLVGERKAGKTSLLYHLPASLPADAFIPVYLDAQTTAPPTDKIFLGKLVRQAADAICNVIGQASIPTTTLQASTLDEVYAAFDHDLEILRKHLPRSVRGQPVRLVWLIDEIEMLRRFQDTHLFSFLRPLAQSDANFRMVVAGYDVLYHLATRSEWSPFFNAFSHVRLPGFNPAVARQLIDDAVLAMDVSITDEVYAPALRWTGRKPFFLKWLMSSIVASLNTQQNRTITNEIFAHAQHIFLNTTDLEQHFAHLWSSYVSEQQQTVLSLIASQPEPYDHPTIFTWLQEHKLVQAGEQQARQNLIKDLMRLEQLGFLYEQAGSYTFTSGCLRTWIEQKKPL